MNMMQVLILWYIIAKVLAYVDSLTAVPEYIENPQSPTKHSWTQPTCHPSTPAATTYRIITPGAVNCFEIHLLVVR